MVTLHIDPSLRLHAWHEGTFWASRHRRVLYRNSGQPGFVDAFRVPGQTFAAVPLVHRLIRQGVANIVPCDGEDRVVVVRGALLFYRGDRLLRIRQTRGGSHPLRQGIAYLPGVGLMYGDYWRNPRRDPVGLHLTTDFGSSWETLWQSGAGEHRHVHCVIADRRSAQAVYFSTGDHHHEPALYHLNVGTGSLRRLGGGDPDWRMISLMQFHDYLIWGTDNEKGANHIIRYDVAGGARARIRSLPGPAYYSVSDRAGNYYLATTVEARRRHRACVYASVDGTDWVELACYRKDFWPARWFGYGTVEWITGQEELDGLYMNLRGLV